MALLFSLPHPAPLDYHNRRPDSAGHRPSEEQKLLKNGPLIWEEGNYRDRSDKTDERGGEGRRGGEGHLLALDDAGLGRVPTAQAAVQTVGTGEGGGRSGWRGPAQH